ncbi:hypothetical protein D6855_15975 [Butyrivibrio sp. CB08]|nr:hypothetical protein D6855_15975 [Butyrivibrio sp. CB08]
MKQDELNKYGCDSLINGIIVLASKDYIKAVRQLRKNPNSKISSATAKECEKFFRSSWYASLTSVEGEWLINRLREEAMKK